jgi:hypothetical protein
MCTSAIDWTGGEIYPPSVPYSLREGNADDARFFRYSDVTVAGAASFVFGVAASP